MTKRTQKRLFHFFLARLPELGLRHIADPRKTRGQRWKELGCVLRGALLALVCGKNNLREVEHFTDVVAGATKRLLQLPRRLPDTTLRHHLVRIDPNALRQSLHQLNHAAHRRKALAPQGLPFGVVAFDGKYTMLSPWKADQDQRLFDVDFNHTYAQVQSQSETSTTHRVGTFTCALVSCRAVPCLDCLPIPADTNEMGYFQTALSHLEAAYGTLSLYRVVSVDSGMCSLENATTIVLRYGRDYVMALKDNQPTLLAEAKRLLDRRTPDSADATTVDVTKPYTVTRRLYLSTEMEDYLDWSHLKVVLRVESETVALASGERVETFTRYFISSLPLEALTPAQWLLVPRLHWGVENQCHNTWDTIFQEDKHPWIRKDAKGMVNVFLLRRIAYTLLSLYRAITQRADETRRVPWKVLMEQLFVLLVSLNDALIDPHRRRRFQVASVLLG